MDLKRGRETAHSNVHDWTPPQGLRVPLGTADNTIVVLKQHENRERTLIAATLFSSDNFERDANDDDQSELGRDLHGHLQ